MPAVGDLLHEHMTLAVEWLDRPYLDGKVRLAHPRAALGFLPR
jgi:hypothetical protein